MDRDYMYTDDLCGHGYTIHYYPEDVSESVVVARAVRDERYAEKIVELLDENGIEPEEK